MRKITLAVLACIALCGCQTTGYERGRLEQIGREEAIKANARALQGQKEADKQAAEEIAKYQKLEREK
jgi:hypothetical protein